MRAYPAVGEQQAPEKLVLRLVRQLRAYVIRDFLLPCLPPTIVFVYLAAYLYDSARMLPIVLLALALGLFALGIAILTVQRTNALSPRLAARLLDEKAAAQDRFLTLATIEPHSCSPNLVERLRRETASVVTIVELRRDFPYEIKRPFYWSAAVSFAALIMFHLLAPVIEKGEIAQAIREPIVQLVDKVAGGMPLVTELRRNVQSLTERFRDRTGPDPEKQTIEEMQRDAEQEKQQEPSGSREALGDSTSTLKGMDRQSASSEGQDQKSGGGVRSNVAQEGQGQSKQGAGGGGDNKGDINARETKQMEQGKTAQGDPKQPSDPTQQQNQSGGKGNQPNKNQPGKEADHQTTAKNETGMDETSSKSKADGKGRSEDNPQGPPPAERFTKPGEEGKGGLKGTRYVTVQLPEELTGEGKPESGATRAGRRSRGRVDGPISNVPLPAHLPDAPAEKQNVPLEYRGILR